MEDEGFRADVAELRRMRSGLIDFESYIEKWNGFV